MKKHLFFALLLLLPGGLLHADEGMWLPFLLGQLNQKDMQAKGFKLTAEDLYSVNKASLKDAIVRFGRGCTGEIISGEGLLLTNHHCGFGQIQYHSSVEKDYISYGFWAKNRSEELPNPGLTATFIIRMEDVTQQMLQYIAPDATPEARAAQMAINQARIQAQATEGTHYEAQVRDFFYGNQFILIVSETFRDVRLVGAPPNAIGSFGGDTDNWMWPRHSADFALFRVYAGKDNLPADYSPENVPLRPRHFLPISIAGVKPGDFTLVYGFPGRTQQYLHNAAVQYVTQQANPAKIAMRDQVLSLMSAGMKQDDRVRIQYAAKYARISNYHKKWIGENRGLKLLNAIETKKAYENRFRQLAAKRAEYFTLPDELAAAHAAIAPVELARELINEYLGTGPEVLRFARTFDMFASRYATLQSDPAQLQKETDRLRSIAEGYFKDYHAPLDEQLFTALSPMVWEKVGQTFTPEEVQMALGRHNGSYEAWAAHLYANSILTNHQKIKDWLDNLSEASVQQLRADPAVQLSTGIYAVLATLEPDYQTRAARIESLMARYVQAQRELMPERKFWPDANSTLRVSYGKVDGSTPRNGMRYEFLTTLEGVMEKHDPSHSPKEEYHVPEKLIELYRKKDYGPYGQNGVMPVCFTASNHTTGGNSGSPVIDAQGRLIGLNFDRSWESTMSDIMYDPERCRNIATDIRYVLFIVDKFADAGYLLKEMKIVSK